MNYLLPCFVLTFIGLTFAQTCDKPNEEYNACGSACPDTCANMNKQDRFCHITPCRSGCFCKSGFVRGSNGTCVLKRDCPQTTYSQEVCVEPNEEYKQCGTTCPEICPNINNKPCIKVRMCMRGCFCKPGFVRNKLPWSGKCVPKQDCPQLYAQKECTKAHEKYSERGSLCPTKCRDHRVIPPLCKPLPIPRAGCFCISPYIRDSSTGQCITRSQCEAFSISSYTKAL